jgi:phytoene dehydrogenase-like protein
VLGDDRAAYGEEKERVAAAVVDLIQARFPGTRGRIEVVDVATPLTFERSPATGADPRRASSSPRGT